MPPSGIGLARTSMTRSRSAKRSRNGSLLGDVAREPLAHRARRLRRCRRRCARRGSAGCDRAAVPTRVSCGGNARISPNCRFQQIEVQVLVEHRDALPHMVERGLQDLAVVVDRGVGIVEELERRLGRDRTLAQQQREHETRRGRADRRGEQMLGIAQELEVGLGLRIEADARASRHSCRTRCGCAPRRDSARRWWSAPRSSPRSATAGSSAAIGVRSEGTNRSACTRSIEAGARRARTPHRRAR